MPELPEVEVVKRSLNNKARNLIVKTVKINDGRLRYKITKDQAKNNWLKARKSLTKIKIFDISL